MINFEDFLDIFKGSEFAQEELKEFYHSVKKSVILRHLGKRAWPELFRIEEKCQWPVLQRIDDPKLSIYKGADKALLERFIRTIDEEKEMRLRKRVMNKVSYWSRLQSIIAERTEIFMHIFDFGKDDLSQAENIAERYAKMQDRRREDKKKMWKIGIGAGAATLAGAAAIWYMTKKEKK